MQPLGTQNRNTGVHGNASQRPDYVAGPGCTPGAVYPGSVLHYINENCFALPKANELGNVGRNTLRSPGLDDFDFSVFKNHNLFNERLKVQFRAEFFNLFNHPNFVAGTQRIFKGSKTVGPNPSGFGLLQQPATTEREIQFGLKFLF